MATSQRYSTKKDGGRTNKIRQEPESRELDRIDVDLLLALQNDARLSNKELANRVGLAPSSCLERVRRLVRLGVVRGFRADVEPAALGIGLQALVAIRLSSHTREAIVGFRDHALTSEEVVAVTETSGTEDFLLHVVARSPEHLRALTLDVVASYEHVAHVETSIIFQEIRRGAPTLLSEPVRPKTRKRVRGVRP